MKTKITAADIRAALRRHYCAPECAIGFEVARGTGYQAKRHLDAVAMELWPSRGLSLHGFEIKVSRSDWRREKAEPAKAEEIAAYLDTFSIVAPPGVVPLTELPSAWGLVEFGVATDDLLDLGKRKLVTVKAPTRTPAKDIDRLFLASIMRACARKLDKDDLDVLLETRKAELEADFEAQVEQRVKDRTHVRNDATEKWGRFTAALGMEPSRYIDDIAIMAAVKIVLKSGVGRSYDGIRSLRKSLTEAVGKIDEALVQIQVPELEKTDR